MNNVRRKGIRVEKLPILSVRAKFFYIILLTLMLGFLARYFLWWINPSHIPGNWTGGMHIFDLLLFIILIFVVFIGYFASTVVWFSFLFSARPKHLSPEKGLRVAFLTCYVPGKEPVDMLKKTLEAIKAVQYPHDTWVLDEGNTPEVKELCKELGVYHFSRYGSRRFNRGVFKAKTKAGNHNAWRHQYEHTYDIVAQADMDHIPNPNFLERTLGYFRDPKVAVVGSPEVYKESDNWVMKGSSEQSAIFHFAMQTGFYGCDMPLLIGTSHLYRTSAMNQIGGYSATIVEDHLTGMKTYSRGFKGVFVPEILAKGHGPLNWVDYFNQQFRWSYGLFEIILFHTPKHILGLKWRQKLNYFITQTYYFTGVGVVLGAILTILYLWTGITPVNMGFFSWLYFSIPPMIASQAIYSFIKNNSIFPDRIPSTLTRGRLLNWGANIIYAVSFIALLLGRRFTYTVTTKEENGQPIAVPLKTFSMHILLLILTLTGLIFSVFSHHTALMQRAWGVFTILTMLAVILSNYFTIIKRYYKLLANLGEVRLFEKSKFTLAELSER